MPFDFMKKKSSEGKDAPKAESGRSVKNAAKGMGFDEADAALKPDNAGAKGGKGPAMPSLRHMLGVGKKDADPAQQRAVTKAIGPIDQALSYALNVGRRAGSFNESAKGDGITDPELMGKVARLGSACKKFDQAGNALLKAYEDYMKRGFMTPMRSAIQDTLKAGLEVRVLLTGLEEAGDSVAVGSLTGDFFAPDVNGVQAGANDTAAGKVPAAPSKKHDTGGKQLPMNGGGAALWARAIRNNATDFVSYFDQFQSGAAGLI